MPGDPRECRQHAARCLELASESKTTPTKNKFLHLASMWTMLAEELERAQAIIDDAKKP